jgi:hypothetical protein
MQAEGIALYLPGRASEAMGVRQARAALQAFLAGTGPGRARASRTRELGGSPRRGFVELAWTPQAGTGGGPYTAFVGFSVSDGAWRIDEIRVFGNSAEVAPDPAGPHSLRP